LPQCGFSNIPPLLSCLRLPFDKAERMAEFMDVG
jgi:hypothetical protein